MTIKIDSNKALELLSKERQDTVKILSHTFKLFEDRAGDNDNVLIYNTKTTLCLK